MLGGCADAISWLPLNHPGETTLQATATKDNIIQLTRFIYVRGKKLHPGHLDPSRNPTSAWWLPSTLLTGSSLPTCELPALYLAPQRCAPPVSPVKYELTVQQ